jgi:predicted RNA-binding Zn-ribbon protein involved in translation (DUF1610 family)
MSVIKAFFRHCPSCGRRFEIRLESKKLLNEDRVTTMVSPTEANVRTGLIAGPATGTSAPLMVGTDVPITIDIESFQYTYKCKHCGHEWSEVRQEEHDE